MKRAALFAAVLALSCAMQAPAFAAYRCVRPEEAGAERESGEWVQDERGRRFTGSDGQIYVSHWLLNHRGYWNYFDENGYAVTGMQTIEGKRRFFDSQGDMETSFFVYDGHLYCAFKDGEIRTSLNGGNDEYSGRQGLPYKFNDQGHAYNENGLWDSVSVKELFPSVDTGSGRSDGWLKEGKTYCYYSGGQKLVNAWKESGGSWFYFDEAGSMVKNTVREIDGKPYKFDSTGAMKTSGSAKDADGNLYAVQNDGTLQAKAPKEPKKEYKDDPGINARHQMFNDKTNPYNNNSTVQWFNATYALLTRSNSANIRAVGGSTKNADLLQDGGSSDAWYADTIRNTLATSWGVTDRATADLVLEQLISSGNSTGSAWDYSRAMSNLGYYYIAGYYSIEETLDKSLEVAKVIQTRFHSWDEFNESYLAGYSAWSGTDGAERRQAWTNLKGSAFNPFTLDWNLPLTKTW